MTRSAHIRRLGTSIACAIAAGAFAAPLAQASGFLTEHSASQNRVDARNAYGAPDPWQYRFVTENSASQNRLHSASPSSTGYRFITENSASQNRLVSSGTAASTAVPGPSNGFDWIAAAVGAAVALTLTLLATSVLAVLRGRRRFAAVS